MTALDALTRISFNIAFDAESDEAIRELWRKIAAHDIAVPGLTGYRPHITLAVYEVTEHASFGADARSIVASTQRFNVRLDSLGIFMEAGVVFLAPRISQKMLSFHQHVIRRFREAGRPEVIAEFLLPDVWVPHVTLASFSGEESLSRTVEVCHAAWVPIHAIAEAMTMRVHPSTDDYRYWPLAVSE